MSIDLKLAFRRTPEDLDRVMASLGFALRKVASAETAPDVEIRSYYHHDRNRSVRGVHYTHYGGVYEDTAEDWKGILENPREIVATGLISTYMRRSDYDLQKQQATARFLRDIFEAMLYDPQTGKTVTD